MANPLLYPLSVSAKVVRAATPVPKLDGDPFNREATLEPGIHVHWALPDALTQSQLLPDKGTSVAVFHGVPDLWLVIRFHPGSSSDTPFGKRRWSAWVVDSIDETVTPLADWKPPTNRDPNKVHTLAGLLPEATAVGYRGWGLIDTSVHQTFDPAVAAYYPASRTRFGFHDLLRGLPEQGKVSYLVVGWFWDEDHDPLTAVARPSDLLKDWKSVAVTEAKSVADLATNVTLNAADIREQPLNIELQIEAAPMPTEAKLRSIKRATKTNGTLRAQQRKLEVMKSNFPADPSSAADLYVPAISAAAHLFAPTQTICHGSIVEVPLAGADTAPVKIEHENVKLYPNIKRAMADVASKHGTADQVNALEMLLADLDSQKYSTGGVVDMPGAAHAYTFQSVPGKSQYYARIEIEAKPTIADYITSFKLEDNETLSAISASGYWPKMKQRSASIVTKSRISYLAESAVKQPPPAPQGPSEQQIAAWLAEVRTAFDTAQQVAAAKGTPIHPRLIHVHDSREKARSLSLGASLTGNGSDGAGWWIDIEDDGALTQLLITSAEARVALPHADGLHEIPGPRWYRPWSPALVLSNIKRSYKFGFDGRFRADGLVKTRFGGDTVTSLAVGVHAAVLGSDLIQRPEQLSAPGIPGEVINLVNETLLLDSESSGAMATASGATGGQLAAAQKDYLAGIHALALESHKKFEASVLNAISIAGEPPSHIGITLWKDPIDPLFIDSNYSHPSSPLSEWKLEVDHVDLTPVSEAATPPTTAETPNYDERSMVTATVVKVLKSAMRTRETLDPRGFLTHVQHVDKKLDAEKFMEMDVASAPLAKLDAQLFADDFRLRAGALRMNHFEVIDIFGFARPWKSPDTSVDNPNAPWWTPLPPRLPYWSRLQFRLMSAADPGVEASAVAPPVVGILLPDFLEHALEVFDGTGTGIGQLTTDRPIRGQTGAITMQVEFKVHPWLPQPANPFDAIVNPTLRALIESIVAQSNVVPAGDAGWEETGLSAMLRVIDTIRGTLDPTAKTADRKVSLIGEPILVTRARLKFEGTATDKLPELAGDPPLLNAPPDLPSLPVRIGDITRPDDGVLGCFISGHTPANGRFAPVTKEAAEKAIVNALAAGFPLGFGNGVEAKHPFVKDMESLFTLAHNQPLDVVILSDIRGGLYATCGALPRKKIQMPQEFIDAAVRKLEPSFYTGPILATQLLDSERALLPPPDVDGYTAEFLHQKPDDPTFSSSEVPSAPPLSELPKKRVLLTEGWLRMIPVKK